MRDRIASNTPEVRIVQYARPLSLRPSLCPIENDSVDSSLTENNGYV